MKQYLFTFMTLALSISALTFVVSCGEDEEVAPKTEQNGNQNGQGNQDEQAGQDGQGDQDEQAGQDGQGDQDGVDENQNDPTAPIIVTVDEDGKADGGHHFVNIDGESFFIDNIKYSPSNWGLVVSGYGKTFFWGEANIISQLNYGPYCMPVREIGKNAFKNCMNLTSVTIPLYVSSIGSGAFQNCTSLTSVTIPSSVTNLGSYAFDNCTGLTAVHITDLAAWCKLWNNIANNVMKEHYDDPFGFEQYKFNYENPLKYAHHLYLNGEEIKDLVIPSTVTKIEFFTFYGCTSLTSVTIPSSVTRIGVDAFFGCKSLTDVTISEGVTTLEGGVFQNCTSLTSVTIPSSVTILGGGAFQNCTSLTSVTIPSSVTNLGSYAFQNCTSLTSVTIPSSVTTIEPGVFQNCTSLTSVTIPSSVTIIKDDSFWNCKGLTDVYCYAETLPSMGSVFYGSPIENATLHVPASAIEVYKTTEPWSGFGSIVAIEESDEVN